MWVAKSAHEAVQRLESRDATLKYIGLNDKHHTDAQLAELVDCMVAHPDIGRTVYLEGNRLTDETGVKLARYLAASSTVKSLCLSSNQFGEATYLAMAAALRVNTSLQYLSLHSNQTVDRTRTDAAFVEALRLNPNRRAGSEWRLYSYLDDIERLQAAAKQLGHPSMQLLLHNVLISPLISPPISPPISPLVPSESPDPHSGHRSCQVA